jgi:CxxC motif-containing protein
MKIQIKNLGIPFTLRIEDDLTGVISKGGNIFKLDEVSVDILRILNQTLSIEKTASNICKLYSVDKDIIKKDIAQFMNELKTEKIIN